MTIETSHSTEQLAKRNVASAMIRGFYQKCPNCNKGNIFGKYLKVNNHCSSCDEALHHHRADDAPPYFTIFIAGHVILPTMMAFEMTYKPAIWIHSLIWLPLTLLMCYLLLPRVKGALIGLQWANYMHGFNPDHDEAKEYAGHSPAPITAPISKNRD